jgi:hypothetical protein
MYQAIEAICRNGAIQPLEPVVFDENEHLVILRLPRPENEPTLIAAQGASIRGALRGRLSSVDDFIAAKQTEIALEEHR